VKNIVRINNEVFSIFKDLYAGIRDIVGERAAAYEKELKKAKEIANK